MTLREKICDSGTSTLREFICTPCEGGACVDPITVYGYPIEIEINTENSLELSTSNEIVVTVEKTDIILELEDDMVVSNTNGVET